MLFKQLILQENSTVLKTLRQSERKMMKVIYAIMLALFLFVNFLYPDISARREMNQLGIFTLLFTLIYDRWIISTAFYNRYWRTLAAVIFSIIVLWGCAISGWISSPWNFVLYLIVVATIPSISAELPLFVATIQMLISLAITLIIPEFHLQVVNDLVLASFRWIAPLLFGLLSWAAMNRLAQKEQLIQESRELVKKVKSRKQQLTFLVNNLDEGVIVCDKSKDILLVNKWIRDLWPHLSFGEKFNEKEIDQQKFALSFISLPDGRELCLVSDRSHSIRLKQMRIHFTSLAAHKLRTPVTTLRGYADTWLEDFSGNNQAKETLSALGEEINKFAQQVEETIHMTDIDIEQL